VRVERVVPGGRGIARDSDGVILVEGGLPGDLVTLSHVSKRGGARFARVLQLVEPSPERREPDCDAHARCGGCDLLALERDAAVRAREEIVRDALRRIARLDDEERARVAPLFAAPIEAGARRRVSLRVDARGRAGFSPRGARTIEPRAACAALAPALDAALERLARAHVKALPPDARVRMACDDDGRVSLTVEDAPMEARVAAARALFEEGVCTGAIVVDEEGFVVDRCGEPLLFGEIAPGHARGPFASDAATFTQATRHGAVRIVDEVVRAARGVRDLVEDDEVQVLELFAGAGHLTIPLADVFADVVAVEGAPRSVRHLVENVERAGAHRVRCIEGNIDGETFVNDYFEQLVEPPALVVVDPPRTGVKDLAGLLRHLTPARLVMVSCDVATGARDLGIARAHGYVLRSLVPIDAFPRTSHVEWVACLDSE